METALVIIVLFVVLGLFGGVGFLFSRETGSGNAVDTARQWLTTSRKSGTSRVTIRPQTVSSRQDDSTDTGAPQPVSPAGGAGAATLTERPGAVQLDDAALRALREELQGELRRASGVTREFDARLTRIEANSVDTPRLSQELERSIENLAAAQRQEIDDLRNGLATVRQTAGPRGERQSEALADLYRHLARVESALAGVVNPMLLPGEPLTLPAELPPETLVWDNWSDVGERAYALGDAFNQHRLVLDPGTANEIERFIAILRQGLTGSVDPNVRTQQPTPAQLAQMRAGLETIVAALPGVRQRVERAYRGEGAMADQ